MDKSTKALCHYTVHKERNLYSKVFSLFSQTFRLFFTYSVSRPIPEFDVLCAMAGDVCHGHSVQDALGSVGSGPQLLFPLSPPLSRTHPALPLGQLLPHLPSSAGPVPRPGRGRGGPTETDQREVRMDRRLGGFAVPTLLHLHHEKWLPQPGTSLKPSKWKVRGFFLVVGREGRADKRENSRGRSCAV